MIKIILIETLAGFVSSVTGFLVTAIAVSQTSLLGSDKTPAFLGFVLGGPLFCVGSFALVEAYMVGHRRISIIGLISGFAVFGAGMFLLISHLRGNLQALLSALLLAGLASVANQMLASRKKAPQTPADR